jgi:hypothetical protein
MGPTHKYLRRTASAVAGSSLGTTINYLRRITSGVAGNGLSRCRGLVMCPFTASAKHSPCFVCDSPLRQVGWGGGLAYCADYLGEEDSSTL